MWFYRNKAFHDGLTFDALKVSAHINKIAFEHFQAWNSVSDAPVEKWIPPAPNWIKINFDTAIRDNFSAQAAVCRNMGEALAAQLAISVASSFSFNRFILEGDSLVVIQSLNSPLTNQNWRISPVILSSLQNIPSDSLWEARKINRSANFCAHSVAR
jgi:hypothetical protein